MTDILTLNSASAPSLQSLQSSSAAMHDNQQPPSGQTPPRRRRRKAAGKTCSSDNDAVLHQPQTPQKTLTPPIARSSNQRPRNRPGSAQMSGPSDAAPPVSTSIPPAATAAFAGVFSASPAASSLPAPSFCARRPADDLPRDSPRRESPPQESATSEPDEPDARPSRPAPPPAPRPEESPLDRIFRADREERERARRTSEVFANSPSRPVTTPTLDGRSSSQATQPQRGTPWGIPSAELDGGSDARSAVGPSFAAPYQERMRAAQGSRASPAANGSRTPYSQQEDRTQALKRYLFGADRVPAMNSAAPTESSPKPLSHPTPTPNGPSTPEYQSRGMSVPPLLASATHPTASAVHRSPKIQNLEDDLKRILKLDSPMTTDGAPQNPRLIS